MDDLERERALEELRERRERRIRERIQPATRAEMVAYRQRVLDRLDTIDPSRFAYITRDRSTHVCPACRADLPDHLTIAWRGALPAADLYCSRGCPTALIAAALTP